MQHAQLVPDPYTEGYQIVLDYAKRLRQVSCPAWAPMIPLEEIEFTVWASSDRRGIWRGKEVGQSLRLLLSQAALSKKADVFYACDDIHMWRLNRSMYSLRRIDGLDLTFELYGHLVNSDGVIVGIVTEAAWGRMVRPSDKEFIASELRRLESYGCVYRGVWCNHLIIADGKLRLLQWLLTKHYTDPEELKRDAAMYHTEYLDTLCQELEDFGPIGHYRFLPDFLTTNNELIKFLRHSIPRYPSTTMLFVYNQERPGFRAVIHYGDDSHDINENDLPMQIASRRARNPQRNPLRLIHSGSRRGDGSYQNDGDAPLSSSHRLRQRVFLSTWNPYHARSTSGRTSRALTYRDSSESDADTVNEI